MKRRSKIRRLLALAKGERGTELPEFAIAASLFFMSMLGVVGFAKAVYCYHFVTWAAQEGARYAIVRGADFSTACGSSAPPSFTMKYGCKAASGDVQNYVQSLTPSGILMSSVSATTTWPGTTPDCSSGCSTCSTTDSAGCLVEVQVTYTFDFGIPYMPKSNLSLTGTSEKVIQE
jgi:Flp pilus assembly protein TadG